MIFNVAPRSRTVVDVMDEVRQLILPMTCSYLSSECLQEGIFVMLVHYLLHTDFGSGWVSYLCVMCTKYITYFLYVCTKCHLTNEVAQSLDWT